MKQVTWQIELIANGNVVLRGDIETIYCKSLLDPIKATLREGAMIELKIKQVTTSVSFLTFFRNRLLERFIDSDN